MQRSLIFHCFPKLGEDWQKCCMSTFKYVDVFNHRILVSIMTGDGCEPAGNVIKWFTQFGQKLEFKLVQNVPSAGINTTFRDQLRAIQQESGIVFKAHTKGISHSGDKFAQWRDNMAFGCLSDIEFVERKFENSYLTFGVYRTFSNDGARVMGQTYGRWRTAWKGWHFPGAFFWFAAKAVPPKFFSLPSHHYENEAFPCHVGSIETSFAVKPDNLVFCSATIAPFFKELSRPLCENEIRAAAAVGHL